MTDYKDRVTEMLQTDCSRFIEKRGSLSYVSWASAWDIVLREDPAATYTVHQFDGFPVQRMPHGGYMAWVDVTIHGKKMTAYLPVMDHRNKAIPEPDAFEINKTIQRCLAKGIALHGIGLYVYRGEDLPTDFNGAPTPAERITEQQASTLVDLIEDTETDRTQFLRWVYGGKPPEGAEIETIPATMYDKAVAALNRKRKQK